MKIRTRVFIILSIIGLCYCGLIFYIIKSNEPVDLNDNNLIQVEIQSGVKQVARELKEKDLIRSKLGFIVKTQLNGTAGKIKSGTYYLSKDMNTDKIVDLTSLGGYSEKASLTIRIPEGSTVEDVADILLYNKIVYDKERFLQECRVASVLKGKDLYKDLKFNEDKKYPLEGYLFPDTYEFETNSKPEDIILKMTARFEEIVNNEIRQQAEGQGLNIDSVITLASIIEKEANINDFTKVSAVLKNRMADKMALQCDSTIRYIVNEKDTMMLSAEQYSYESPYNSYKTKDLPPSPICSPSLKAIEAVLNPDQNMLDEKYLYFCSTENSARDLVFAKTYEEHLVNVKKYIGDWRNYDQAVRDN